MRSSLLATIAIFGLLAAAAPARSAGLVLHPVRVFFAPEGRSEILQVRNESGRPLTLQARLYAWGQEGDPATDRYDPTSSLLFFPRMVTLAPGEQKVIRIAPRVPPADAERTFRLYLEEIPDPVRPAGTFLRTQLRIGVPLFVAPREAHVAARLENLRFDGETVAFRVRNDGNVHVPPASFRVEAFDAAGASLFTEQWSGWYVLPGASAVFERGVPVGPAAAACRVVLEMGFADRRLVEELRIGNGGCGS